MGLAQESIKRFKIEDWLLKLELSNQTRNHILYTFRLVLDEAERQELIQGNPTKNIESLGASPESREPYTLDELKKLFPLDETKLLEIWTDYKNAACFMVLATAGLRGQEVRALEWRHILPGGALHIMQAVDPFDDSSIKSVKNKEARVVLIPTRTQAVLNRWKRDAVFTDPEHFIFYGADARKPLRRKYLTETLAAALVTAKVDQRGRDVHGIRHSYNTIMRRVLSDDLLRMMTGHKTKEMSDLYDHPTLDDNIRKLEGSRPLLEQVWKI